MSQPAYQPNAYQKDAYQAGLEFIPAFQADAFQFGAFQQDEPQPPEPTLLDGHDGGRRKRALKKLQELEDKRIAMVREQAERRKMEIRFAVDPQAKAEYEAKLAKSEIKGKPLKDISKEIAKIDAQIAKVEKLKQNIQLQAIIKAELNNIYVARQIREQEIRRQIQEADDELALLMMM